jgi:hypothetical protein
VSFQIFGPAAAARANRPSAAADGRDDVDDFSLSTAKIANSSAETRTAVITVSMSPDFAAKWLVSRALIDVVVRFWREFFSLYHPDPEVRAGVRDWRLL